MNQAQSAAQLPEHVAIIMDGNNRYAKQNLLGQGGGHRAGKQQLDPIVEQCRRLGIKALTVFAFSSENWNRPLSEVNLIMDLLRETIREQLPRMQKYDIALRFIGDRSRLAPDLQQLMQQAEQQTAHHRSMLLTIAVSYGGMWDITQAARQIADRVLSGTLRPSDISETTFQTYLSLADVAPVDLLIRTGGDYRISNFLLWQVAYAEFYFTDTLWPNFTIDEFDHALAVFAQRERRFGRTSEQIRSP